MKIKYLFLIIIFILFRSIYNLNAQEINPIKFGVKAGLNFSSFAGNDSKKFSSITRFQFGGFINYKLDNVFAIQTEAIFSFKGAKLSENYEDFDYIGTPPTIVYYEANEEVVTKLDYIEIPILIKAMIPLDFYSIFRPYIEFGPSLAFEISSKAKASAEIKYYLNNVLFDKETASVEEDISKDIKNMDLGLNIGGGLNIFNNFGLNIRYIYGLSKISEKDKPDLKNQVITLTLNYNF